MEITKIKEMIAKNKSKEAMQIVLDFCKENANHSDYYDSVVLLSSRLKEYTTRKKLGLKYDSSELNEINFNFLEILNSLNEDKSISGEIKINLQKRVIHKVQSEQRRVNSRKVVIIASPILVITLFSLLSFQTALMISLGLVIMFLIIKGGFDII